MDAVFTIVAKNYLAKARTFGDSVKAIHPELDFYIFLSDEAEGILDLSKEKYRIIEIKDIDIPRYREMAFKYSVLEFSTAVKPFCFEYIFKQQYERVIYFDPDIYIYNSLDSIFALLNHSFMVITPHITEIDVSKERAAIETEYLFVGAYNLGFIALRKCEETRRFLKWWQVRLEYFGFADHQDAMHVDQKWIDLVPSLFGKGVHISRNPGLNLAFWNFYERTLDIKDGVYYVNGEPLIFFHCASNTTNRPYAQKEKPEYVHLIKSYEECIARNGHSEYLNYPYKYAHYDNDISIFSFHRRIYRKLLEQRPIFSDPFSTDPGSFYELLRVNRLIINETSKSGYTRKDFHSSGKLISGYQLGMNMLKGTIGIRYYHLLSRLLRNTSRPEDQLYLIKKGLADLK